MLSVFDGSSEIQLLFGTNRVDARAVAPGALDQIPDPRTRRRSIDAGCLDRTDDLDDDLATGGRGRHARIRLTFVAGRLGTR